MKYHEESCGSGSVSVFKEGYKEGTEGVEGAIAGGLGGGIAK